MSAFQGLPTIYKLAVLHGARVEIYLDKDEKWFPYSQIIGVSYRSKIRVAPGDEEVLEQVKSLLPNFYDIVEFDGYNYYLPKSAKKVGSITMMSYGFGVYVQTKDDGSLLQLERKVAEQILDETKTTPYVSVSEQTFFGTE
jgi:hypothetical protein